MVNKGGLSVAEMRKMLNKKHGMTVAHNLQDENPTEVTEWIPTGSRWLDSIVCRGQLAGIPVGKVTEIAGLEATGKSYSGDPPFMFTAQGYLYANTIINYSGQHIGKAGFGTLYMFQYHFL